MRSPPGGIQVQIAETFVAMSPAVSYYFASYALRATVSALRALLMFHEILLAAAQVAAAQKATLLMLTKVALGNAY